MTDQPRNGDRVIITAEYLANIFPMEDVTVYFHSLTPFTLEPKFAELFFDAMIKNLEESEFKDHPGKQGAIEFWGHLQSAYRKLSLFERKRIQADLPGAIAKRFEAKK